MVAAKISDDRYFNNAFYGKVGSWIGDPCVCVCVCVRARVCVSLLPHKPPCFPSLRHVHRPSLTLKLQEEPQARLHSSP